ncbi:MULTISPECIES: hypothetical protein [Thalassospira]|uniref:Uncharacterized protein n=2 Tax=Thalassospira TaxID=168934 RepID=A0A367W177_9PROT|nr:MULTISPECIES: hypothetical protein [Thalassospira]MDG4721753.1 hypothetical protein [Thalassospira sp. FZY0004]RCK31296.1 hypothetical protein TH19_21295 [Thalassospira profundimaris]
MSGQAHKDIATASNRKDAVRKAFNQEYLATQKAMTQAAERAREQVLDQRYTISNHTGQVRSGTTAPQPPIGAGQSPRQPSGQPAQGAPNMSSPANLQGDQQVMFEIANEIRNIITREIDLRMQVLSEKVETALAAAFPATNAEDTDDRATSSRGNDKTAARSGSKNPAP